MSHPSVVSGGGLTGALLAIRLADRGEPVRLLDRRPDPRLGEGEQRRSINLALSTRGLDAVDRVGLRDRVLRDAVMMEGRLIHGRDGDVSSQRYGTRPEHVLHSVDRDALTVALFEAIDTREGIETWFSCGVRDVNIKTPHALVERDGSEELEQVPFTALYGTDGAYSTVRLRLQKTGRFEFHQEFLTHGYKELTIPAAEAGGYRIEPHALHIWPRGDHMMIALPNPDGSFTATLFWPFTGLNSFTAAASEDEVRRVFERQYPDVGGLIPDLVEQYAASPISNLVTVRCGPWFHEGLICILGDAAHTVVPFYGQGANAGMEDVTLLCDALETAGSDRRRAFAEFYASRKPHTDALAELSEENFVEMRAKVSSRVFLAVRGFERLIQRLAPDHFPTLYTLVTFTRTPYADAVARARRAERILGSLSAALTFVLLAVIVAVVLLLWA